MAEQVGLEIYILSFILDLLLQIFACILTILAEFCIIFPCFEANAKIVHLTFKQSLVCEFSGFRPGVAEVFAVLGCYALLVGVQIPNFRYSAWKMRPIDCPETSVTKHQPTYHLRRAKTRTLLTLSKSVIFRILFVIPYHLALEMKVQNIAK